MARWLLFAAGGVAYVLVGDGTLLVRTISVVFGLGAAAYLTFRYCRASLEITDVTMSVVNRDGREFCVSRSDIAAVSIVLEQSLLIVVVVTTSQGNVLRLDATERLRWRRSLPSEVCRRLRHSHRTVT